MPTLYEKLLDRHTVVRLSPDEVLLYVSFHIMNEYTSPQAFSGLEAFGRNVWRPEAHLGVVDHVNSTRRFGAGPLDTQAELLISNFEMNCSRHNIRFFGVDDSRQGIEHVVVPEQGLARPGIVIACGDSHTTTYGAFGALGFGIGTSEVEHILATQTIVYRPLKPMRIKVIGELGPGLTAKDFIMEAVRQVGAGGALGHCVEFQGEAISQLDMAGRMTICNMAVEMGARAAIIAPDHKVIDALRNRPLGPSDQELKQREAELRSWRSDDNAVFSKELTIDAGQIAPLVTWGTSPDQAAPVNAKVPTLETLEPSQQSSTKRALDYMGLEEGQSLEGIPIDIAFIGSCTNSRIEDLRAAAAVLRGRKVAPSVQTIIVPGSQHVRQQAEAEGLGKVFEEAGCEWRPASGCSMCLAMNDDIATAGIRLASSTNRNFEGRQGRGARTHLMSPSMVAAAAVAGHLTDVRNFAPLKTQEATHA